jgi:hypothetical protein
MKDFRNGWKICQFQTDSHEQDKLGIFYNFCLSPSVTFGKIS